MENQKTGSVMTYSQLSKDYDKLIKFLEKNSHLQGFDISVVKGTKNKHLLLFELENILGLSMYSVSYYRDSYIEMNNYWVYRKWEENQQISWSDDGRQPEVGERLLEVSFSTGAYIFGDQYDRTTFNEFFVELAGYGAKYKDSMNSNLYFDLYKSKEVFNSFKDILSKYRGIAKERLEAERIQKLEKELQDLKSKK